jgi:ribose transport system permease protein
MKRAFLERLPLVILCLLIVVGTLLSRSFLTVNNLTNVIQYNAELAFICLGLVLVIIAGNGGIDLSVGSTMAFTGVLVASNGKFLGIFGCIALAIAVGAAIGFVNGLIVTKGYVEPFIGTFTIGAIMTALTLLYTKGGPVLETIPTSVSGIANAKLLGFPLPFFYFFLAYAIGVILLGHTAFGRHLYAMGVNTETVRLVGINVQRVKVLIYVLSGVLAALAGLLTTARLGMGEPRAGLGMELTAISAVVVGGVSLYGGKGTATGAFVGVLIFAVVLNLMNILNMSAYYQPMAKGFIIIVAGLLLSRRRTMFSALG